jgi:hypothetical protein
MHSRKKQCGLAKMHSGKCGLFFVVDVLAEKKRKEQRDLPREFPNKISVIIMQVNSCVHVHVVRLYVFFMKLIFIFLYTLKKGSNFLGEGNHVHVVSVLRMVQFSPFHVLIPFIYCCSDQGTCLLDDSFIFFFR